MSAGVTPFTISVPDAAIDRLRQKLDLTSLPDEPDATDLWAYGAPLADIKRLKEYWATKFDWRKAEQHLNEQLPQFRAKVPVKSGGADGAGFGEVEVHFVHWKSGVEGAVPLLFCHGWPGSFHEIIKLLPLLKGADGTPAFDVVSPSLPNFGFSPALRKPGFGLDQYGELCHNLMLLLGYDQYATQGGDFGAWITRSMALHYPQHCRSTHLNLVKPPFPSAFRSPWAFLKALIKPWSKREKDGMAYMMSYVKEGMGYLQLQTTKPQTLAYGLADSPVALLAWIYEKLHLWTDEYPWTDDELLTWISLYWFAEAGPAANVRIYYESTHAGPDGGGGLTSAKDPYFEYIPNVKVGVAHFPKEVVQLPMDWVHGIGPIAYQRIHDQGGHFAAWEQPKALAGDLHAMFGKGGPCYGVVEGKTGYGSDEATN